MSNSNATTKRRTRQGMPLYTTYECRCVLAGFLAKNGVFRKQVRTGQKLIKLDSYGIDELIVRELERLGCKRIELEEIDTDTYFSVPFDEFKAKAIPRQIGKFGTRYYLPLKYWGLAESGNKSPGGDLFES